MRADQRLTREQSRERDAQIVAAVRAGRTLHEVGAEHDMTRERIRQIVKRDAPDLNVRSARTERVRVRHAQTNEQAMRVREAYRRKVDRARGRTESEWSDEEMIECMREVFAERGPISLAKWREISAQEWVPSAALYTVRFGSWNEAKRAAGLPTVNYRALDTYSREYSREDLIEIVARFLRTAKPEDGWFGASHYERWRLENGGPSLALIRVRMSRWSDAKQAAIAYNEEHPHG